MYYQTEAAIQKNISAYCKTQFKSTEEIKLCTNRYEGKNNYTLITNYGIEIQKNLTEARDAVIVTPIIYDEISNFKNSTSYPFEKRKNTLIANKNDNPYAGVTMFKQGELRKIFLNVATVCFDKKWYSDILFWRDDGPCDGEDAE